MQYVAHIAMAAWFAAGTAAALAAPPPDEIGVLTCTVGPNVGAAASDTSVGNEAREMFCSFKTGLGPEETYGGLLRSIGDKPAAGRALLWSVRAPLGTRFKPGASAAGLHGRQIDAGGTSACAYRRTQRHTLSAQSDREAPGGRLKGRAASPGVHGSGHGIGSQGCGRLADGAEPRIGPDCEKQTS